MPERSAGAPTARGEGGEGEEEGAEEVGDALHLDSHLCLGTHLSGGRRGVDWGGGIPHGKQAPGRACFRYCRGQGNAPNYS